MDRNPKALVRPARRSGYGMLPDERVFGVLAPAGERRSQGDATVDGGRPRQEVEDSSRVHSSADADQNDDGSVAGSAMKQKQKVLEAQREQTQELMAEVRWLFKELTLKINENRP